MAYEELKFSGITNDTPKNILLGAGTIHKNLMLGYYTKCQSTDANALHIVADSATPTTGEVKLSTVKAKTAQSVDVGDYVKLVSDKWNFEDSIIGATQDGNKLTIEVERLNVEPDGALVKVKGLEFKIGETATLEVNLLEITKDNIKMLTNGKEASSSSFSGYDEIISKAQIETGDYFTNFAFIGHRTDGTPIIVIFDNAKCTSGFSADTKNKENSTFPATFECYADISDNPNKLPWHILVPTAS